MSAKVTGKKQIQKRAATPRVVRSINFDEDVLREVKALGKERKRSVSWLVNEAVRKGLAAAGTSA